MNRDIKIFNLTFRYGYTVEELYSKKYQELVKKPFIIVNSKGNINPYGIFTIRINEKGILKINIPRYHNTRPIKDVKLFTPEKILEITKNWGKQKYEEGLLYKKKISGRYKEKDLKIYL